MRQKKDLKPGQKCKIINCISEARKYNGLMCEIISLHSYDSDAWCKIYNICILSKNIRITLKRSRLEPINEYNGKLIDRWTL